MKRTSLLFASLIVTILITIGCSKESTPDKITVASLKGPTGMGLSKLMDTHQKTKDSFEFILSGTPDDLVGKIINKEIDIACVPTNLAAVLYNKTNGGIQLAAVNTLGSLYILDHTGKIHTIEDLKGQTIYVSGQGSTPDFVLRYLLSEAGIDPEKDLIIDFSMQHADLATAVASGEVQIALLPQPYVTTVQMKNPDIQIALDLNEFWKSTSDNNADLFMGCVIVQKDFAENYPETLSAFLKEYKESVDWVNGNPQDAGVLIEAADIIPNAKLAEKAIPLCKIVYIDSKSAQPSLQNYYQILLDFDAKSVGGKLPDEGLYY